MAIGDNGVNIAYKSMMELRLNGYSCEMNTENKSFKALFKTALRKNAKFAIIIGDDEIQSGEIAIKNLKTQPGETRQKPAPKRALALNPSKQSCSLRTQTI